MDYIETGFSNHMLSNAEFNTRANLIKIGCVLQIIIFSLLMIMRIVITILDDTIHIIYNIFAVVFQVITLASTIGSLVLFLIGFNKLSETFTEDIQKNMRLSMILLVSFIVVAQLILVVLNFIIDFGYGNDTIQFTYSGITNIITTGVLIAAFVFMDQTVQKTYEFGMQKKRKVGSTYIILTVGILQIIFSFIYYFLDLPYYSATIVQSIFNIVIIIGFIEYILFLNSFHMNNQPFEKLVIEQKATIHQEE